MYFAAVSREPPSARVCSGLVGISVCCMSGCWRKGSQFGPVSPSSRRVACCPTNLNGSRAASRCSFFPSGRPGHAALTRSLGSGSKEGGRV